MSDPRDHHHPPTGDDDVPSDATLQIHALEWAIRELTFENHDLRVRLMDAEATMHQFYGSRGWRMLESARGLLRGRK